MKKRTPRTTQAARKIEVTSPKEHETFVLLARLVRASKTEDDAAVILKQSHDAYVDAQWEAVKSAGKSAMGVVSSLMRAFTSKAGTNAVKEASHNMRRNPQTGELTWIACTACGGEHAPNDGQACALLGGRPKASDVVRKVDYEHMSACAYRTRRRAQGDGPCGCPGVAS